MAATYLPTLKQLQYLVALRDHGHFGRAADSCFVTQSTLSAGLRELETLIGVVLVERTRRVVRFTPLGEQIAAKARRVLREAEELGDLARAAGRPLSGELRLSVIPTIAPFLLPRILPKLRRDYPDLKLYLREEPSAAACDSLAGGRADCVLLALPYACGDVATQALFEDRLFLAFPDTDRQAASATIRPEEIDEARLLLLEDGHCLKDHALAGVQPPRTPRRGDHAGDLAPHGRPDGRQRARGDDPARTGGDGRHPGAYPPRRASARSRAPEPDGRARLAAGVPPRTRLPPARRCVRGGIAAKPFRI